MRPLNFDMQPDKIYFVPLGGCGMFGCNVNLYGYNNKWIMVDLGIGFADETIPGVETILPNIDFAAELGDDLLGIFITHAHEDHIGGVRYLWNKLKKPIYATKFNIERIKQAVSEQPWGNRTLLNEVKIGGTVSLDDFKIEFIKVAHSIPEASALAITFGKLGSVIHTGDWQIDENPVEGNSTDVERLQKLTNIISVVSDSTNVVYEGNSESEQSIQKSFLEIFPKTDKAIAVTCFSTNVARIHSIAKAAEAIGRKVCLVGSSLSRIDEIARKCGYLKNISPFIDDVKAEELNAYDLVYICTGSQGERLSALSRIAKNEHPRVKFGADTTVFFSSRDIPGNESQIKNLQNNLCSLGCNVVTIKDKNIHVSGHPCRDEMELLYNWVKPKSVIPVHGDMINLEKHLDLVNKCGITNVCIPENGDVIEISHDGKLVKIDEVHSGLLAIEGENNDRIIAIDDETILNRRRIMYNGSAVATVVINYKAELVAKPQITALGLLDGKGDTQILNEAIEGISELIRNIPKNYRDNDAKISEKLRISVRNFLREKCGKNPQVRIHLVRI